MATRLGELSLVDCRLQGSAGGFLTEGWTALTSLVLTGSRVTDDAVPPALNLPALEDISMDDFGYQGGRLQLDQLISSWPQVSGLKFDWEPSMAQHSEGSGLHVSLLSLARLADLQVAKCCHISVLHWELPVSLMHLTIDGGGPGGRRPVNLFWVVRAAVDCILRGAQLRSLCCANAEATQQHTSWGVGLAEQYRLQGVQLSSLKELNVWGLQGPLSRAVGVLANSAPSLTSLVFAIQGQQHPMELPPICSASLESITVHCYSRGYWAPHPPVVLTFLPGCTQLREVLVRFRDTPREGTAVRIRCHCRSRRCIVPLDGVTEEAPLHKHGVGICFLPTSPAPKGVQKGFTVMYACRAGVSWDKPVWGHVVKPGCL